MVLKVSLIFILKIQMRFLQSREITKYFTFHHWSGGTFNRDLHLSCQYLNQWIVSCFRLYIQILIGYQILCKIMYNALIFTIVLKRYVFLYVILFSLCNFICSAIIWLSFVPWPGEKIELQQNCSYTSRLESYLKENPNIN